MLYFRDYKTKLFINLTDGILKYGKIILIAQAFVRIRVMLKFWVGNYKTLEVTVLEQYGMTVYGRI